MEIERIETSRSSKTEILIADDHPVVVEGITRALEREPGFVIVGTASTGLEAIQKVKTLAPDIVIMDISMPDMKGTDATHEIKTWKEQIRVLIYTVYSDREYFTSLFRLGISGYVLKGEPMRDLVQAVKVIANGGSYFSSSAQKVLRDQMDALAIEGLPGVRETGNGFSRLTVREREVFILLADGLTPKEIAKRLYISPKTVETHKYNIMEKLEVSSVAQLTKIAIQKQLIKV